MFGGVCEDETGFADCRAWAQEHWSALASHATGSAYSNFMADADDDAVLAAWGPEKYERLGAVKGRHDPANRFRFNHNIPPAIRGAGGQLRRDSDAGSQRRAYQLSSPIRHR